MQLTIESVTPSKSGKALRVKSGDKWYGAKKDSGIKEGLTIEAEVSDGDYGLWIDAWKPVSVPAKANGSTPPGSNSAPVWLQMASNVLAHALNAGVLKEPTEIKAWVLAVKQAVEGE